MKDRLPLEKREAMSGEEEKSSPLYSFLQIVKKYISGYGNAKDVTGILEDTCREFMRLIKDVEQELSSESYSQDSLAGFASMIETIEDIDEREFLMSPKKGKIKRSF